MMRWYRSRTPRGRLRNDLPEFQKCLSILQKEPFSLRRA